MDRDGDHPHEQKDPFPSWNKVRWDVALKVASGALIAGTGAADATAATPDDRAAAPQAKPDRSTETQQAAALSERARAVARPVAAATAPPEPLTVGRRPARLRTAQLSTPPTVSTPPVRPRPTTHTEVEEAVVEALPDRENARVHTVRAGETLWSIATDALGEQATPSRVAALVQRLWALNASGIASGRPHLLAEGERVVMP